MHLCKMCDTPLTKTQYRNIYCSRKCKGKAESKIKELCKMCDNPVPRRENIYCSNECRYADPEYIEKQREIRLGEKSWNYKGPKPLCKKCDNPVKQHHNIYCSKKCMYECPEWLKKQRERAIGEKNNRFGKRPAFNCEKWMRKGKRLLGHMVRSSWEFKFAKFLQDNGIKYRYEPKAFLVRIDGIQGTYRPDFYIPKQENGGLWILPFPPDSYVEVKGYMREISQKKINSFRKRYHWHRLILLDKHEITKIIRV